MLNHFVSVTFFQARNAERVYLIGGSTDERNPEKASTAVTRICLSRSFIGRVAPLPVATWRPAVATAPNIIAVCGGTYDDAPLPNCQVYSRKTDRYAGLLKTINASIAFPHIPGVLEPSKPDKTYVQYVT